MTIEQILSCLCVYDERNPNYLPFDEDDLSRKPIDCACDNCYYGREKMAEFILSQLPQQEISDDQAIKMLKDMNKQPMRFHCVPKEISDEEIHTEAKNHHNYYEWSAGAKWYREQLKQR